MTTLIFGSGDRRCDARCYDAKEPECECVCGGKNHGVGQVKARANVRDLVRDLAAKSSKRDAVDEVFGDPLSVFVQGEMRLE